MPQFEMNGGHLPEFAALSDFVQGYIEALFFTSTEPGTIRPRSADESAADFKARRGTSRVWNPETDSSLPGECGFADLHPDTVASIVKDCEAFESRVTALLAAVYEHGTKRGAYDAKQAGRDFWFTRNGHGVGYWDRGFVDIEGVTTGEQLGGALSEAARRAGESDVYLGDDGKVYAS